MSRTADPKGPPLTPAAKNRPLQHPGAPEGIARADFCGGDLRLLIEASPAKQAYGRLEPEMGIRRSPQDDCPSGIRFSLDPGAVSQVSHHMHASHRHSQVSGQESREIQGVDVGGLAQRPQAILEPSVRETPERGRSKYTRPILPIARLYGPRVRREADPDRRGTTE
jgi:hypothetical protein